MAVIGGTLETDLVINVPIGTTVNSTDNKSGKVDTIERVTQPPSEFMYNSTPIPFAQAAR